VIHLSHAASARAGSASRRAPIAVLLAACLVPLVCPGDIPFINDEPLLIASAVAANEKGELAQRGLLGTFGVSYGPAPTWVYQALVAITRNLLAVAVLHTVLMAVTTAGALYWLSRSLGLWVWFAPLPLLSPYFWFYARVLWDNPFLIPLGTLAIAGYAAHLSSGSAAGLRVSVAALMVIPLVHLMALAVVVPLAVHIVVVRWRALWAHRFSVSAIVALFVLMARPYWTYLATYAAPSARAARTADGWLFPLFGGRLLSARELDYFYGQGPVSGAVFEAAAALSGLAYGLVWAGIGIALWSVTDAVRTRRWPARAHLAIILLASLVAQGVIHGLSGKFEHPHYHNATWITFVLLSWFAVDGVVRLRSPLRWSAIAATGVLAVALVTSVALLTVRLHRTGGTRELYGPTIANQLRVGRALAQYSPKSRLESEVIHYSRFPHTLEILRQLTAGDDQDRPERNLQLRYASDDPASGVIELVQR
jgi:hypothetical protein